MRIIVGTDGSPQASAGVRWVATMPLTPGDRVVVVTVVSRPVLHGAWGYMHTPLTLELTEAAWQQALSDGHRIVDESLDEFRGLPCPVTPRVIEGHPIDGLRRVVQEEEADLLVVGPHGHGRLESILLGSVSQSMLHAMPTAVLIAREPISPPRRILLAVDGSPASAAATGLLARLPLAAGAEIDIVTALSDWPDLTRDQGAADLSANLGALERQHVGEVIGQAETILGSTGRSGHPLVREGDAKREILKVASERGSDLIVVGARGLGGFKGLILGSVSRAVSKAAPCSVLVVPAVPGGT